MLEIKVSINLEARYLADAITALAESIRGRDFIQATAASEAPAHLKVDNSDSVSSASIDTEELSKSKKSKKDPKLAQKNRQIKPDADDGSENDSGRAIPNSDSEMNAEEKNGDKEPTNTPDQGYSAPEIPEKSGHSTVDLETISRAGAALIDQGKMTSVIELLHKFNVQAVTQLKSEDYADFAEGLRELGAEV